jgi:hypothetical protein
MLVGENGIYQSASSGIMQTPAPTSFVTEIEQCMPTSSGRASRKEWASFNASISADFSSGKSWIPWSVTMRNELEMVKWHRAAAQIRRQQCKFWDEPEFHSPRSTLNVLPAFIAPHEP